VRVLGFVSDQQLATLYAHALFLAMPSLYEGFGLPLLEATSRGVPVLTSDIASMPEVAGEAGLVDLHWLDRCPLLAPWRGSAELRPLQAEVRRRAGAAAPTRHLHTHTT
jgi:hypothetical protein